MKKEGLKLTKSQSKLLKDNFIYVTSDSAKLKTEIKKSIDSIAFRLSGIDLEIKKITDKKKPFIQNRKLLNQILLKIK